MQVAGASSVQTTIHVERPELLDQAMKAVLSLPDVSGVYKGAYTVSGDSHMCLPWLLTSHCWTPLSMQHFWRHSLGFLKLFLEPTDLQAGDV